MEAQFCQKTNDKLLIINIIIMIQILDFVSHNLNLVSLDFYWSHNFQHFDLIDLIFKFLLMWKSWLKRNNKTLCKCLTYEVQMMMMITEVKYYLMILTSHILTYSDDNFYSWWKCLIVSWLFLNKKMIFEVRIVNKSKNWAVMSFHTAIWLSNVKVKQQNLNVT